MRLWSIHPQYLDTIGLVALWREALLAKKVLEGNTKGYKYHPQLIRFKEHPEPISAINSYLVTIFEEASKRGYSFDKGKIENEITQTNIFVTSGQIKYEFEHLKKKLFKRDRKKYFEISRLKRIRPNPIFKVVRGKIAYWERVNKIL